MSLTGCASPPATVPEVRIVRERVPAALLICQPAPAVPDSVADDRDLARYIIALATAGDDCRDQLARVAAHLAEGS